jgi:energy-coupling factor transport system ATP-binding protein
MIELKNISFSYGRNNNKISALKNVDLQISEGEFVSIVGANGSGKSTLARLLNGLLLPDEGKILVDSLSTANTDEIWEIRKRVGFVFQNPDNQLVASTVEEDVAFGPENLGLSRDGIKQRVNDALVTVNMFKYASHEPHMLSGGQKQKVAIAGTLAMNAKYLVLDEATSMLDEKGSDEIISTLRMLNKEKGLGVVNITHKPEEAVYADRIIVLASGEIVADGNPREVLTDVDMLSLRKVNAPIAVQMAAQLKARGVSVHDGILTVQDLVDALC